MEKQMTGGEGGWNAEMLDKQGDLCKEDPEERLTHVSSIWGRHMGCRTSLVHEENDAPGKEEEARNQHWQDVRFRKHCGSNLR